MACSGTERGSGKIRVIVCMFSFRHTPHCNHRLSEPSRDRCDSRSNHSQLIAAVCVCLSPRFLYWQDNYPEILFKAFIVPVNWFFYSVHSTISGFIDERSKAKIQLIKEADMENWWKGTFPAAIIPMTLGKCREGGRDVTVLTEPLSTILFRHLIVCTSISRDLSRLSERSEQGLFE